MWTLILFSSAGVFVDVDCITNIWDLCSGHFLGDPSTVK